MSRCPCPSQAATTNHHRLGLIKEWKFTSQALAAEQCQELASGEDLPASSSAVDAGRQEGRECVPGPHRLYDRLTLLVTAWSIHES